MTTKLIAEYIWLGADNEFRSKARTLEITSADDLEIENLPLWNYDGSSTGQAEGSDSEVILKPCAIFNCPFRGGNNILIWCSTYTFDDIPLPNNTRDNAVKIFDQHKDELPWYGIEQEYFIINPATGKPLGFPKDGYPEPQGKYYCGVGSSKVFGRKIADMHYKLCLMAGVKISGINAEVAPGQWEFQVGPCTGIESGDHLWIARYLLERIAELNNIYISYDPKPVKGDWNGSGCHTNFSTKYMREGNGATEGIEFINNAISNLSLKHKEHMEVYGKGNEERLTGHHETAKYDEFSSDARNRNTSIRIPNTTIENGKGYFEDRRPAANMDPYLVTSKIFETTVVDCKTI